MIAVQRMPSMFPLHRLDSVTPSSTRGVLHIKSKSQPQSVPKPSNKSRGSPRSKPQQRRSPQSAAQVIVDKLNPTSASPAKADPILTSAEKSIRGRKHKSLKDAGRSDNSVSHSDVPARRHAHQPSPSRMLSPPQATVSADLFTDDVVVPLQDSRADGRFRSPPKLAQPSGKLARRRQAHLGSPTPKVVFRGKFDQPREIAPLQFIPLNSDVQPNRRASTDFTWDHMCDDSSADDSDISPPTTPIREIEISTVPSKKGTWQQGNFDDAPHTAPLASTFGYPFVGHNPCSTPTPAQRRRNHRRVPSEGVFVMSTDEDSSSSVSDLFESLHIKRHSPVSIPRQRCYTVPAGGSPSLDVVPSHILSSSAPAAAGYFAGSVFQNSPSPDDLPAPSFGL